MTQEELLVRSLLCCLAKIGGSIEITTELFDSVTDLQVVFNRDDVNGIISLSYKSTEIIIGQLVDNDPVDALE